MSWKWMHADSESVEASVNQHYENNDFNVLYLMTTSMWDEMTSTEQQSETEWVRSYIIINTTDGQHIHADNYLYTATTTRLQNWTQTRSKTSNTTRLQTGEHS